MVNCVFLSEVEGGHGVRERQTGTRRKSDTCQNNGCESLGDQSGEDRRREVSLTQKDQGEADRRKTSGSET